MAIRKFEYMACRTCADVETNDLVTDVESHMQNHGKDGWELASMGKEVGWYKRELPRSCQFCEVIEGQEHTMTCPENGMQP